VHLPAPRVPVCTPPSLHDSRSPLRVPLSHCQSAVTEAASCPSSLARRGQMGDSEPPTGTAHPHGPVTAAPPGPVATSCGDPGRALTRRWPWASGWAAAAQPLRPHHKNPKIPGPSAQWQDHVCNHSSCSSSLTDTRPTNAPSPAASLLSSLLSPSESPSTLGGGRMSVLVSSPRHDSSSLGSGSSGPASSSAVSVDTLRYTYASRELLHWLRNGLGRDFLAWLGGLWLGTLASTRL
jgi:hypothetical protein